MNEYGTLNSSNGTVVFRVSDGTVAVERSEWDYDPSVRFNLPTRVDVAEWQRTYPGEDVSAGHDILDFGLWFDETYFPPDAEFRKEWWIYGSRNTTKADQ